MSSENIVISFRGAPSPSPSHSAGWNQNEKQRNWVFATSSKFLIPKSLQLDVANLRYFKSNLTEIIVRNIYGLHHQVPEIQGSENQSLCLRINSFKFAEN